MLFPCDMWHSGHAFGNVINVTWKNESSETEHLVLAVTPQGFSIASALVFLATLTHWCVCGGWSCPAHRRTFSSIPSLYPQSARSNIPPYCDNHKCRHCQTSSAGQERKKKITFNREDCANAITLFYTSMSLDYIWRLSQYSWYLYKNISSLKRDKAFSASLSPMSL